MTIHQHRGVPFVGLSDNQVEIGVLPQLLQGFHVFPSERERSTIRNFVGIFVSKTLQAYSTIRNFVGIFVSKTLQAYSWARRRARYRKRNLKRKRRTINLLLLGTLYRMMFAPVPTMTFHFVLFVVVCPSLVLMWWRPCTLGHLRLTCVHKRPPSPPFNCFVPLSTLFHPFTTLSINLNFTVTFLFVITCFFVSYFALACMYIIVLVVCCKITFGPVHPLRRRTRKRLGQNRLWNEVWNCYCYSVCYFSCLRTIFLESLM